MALVPGGATRASPRRPSRDIASFCIDRLEATVDQYAACVRDGRCAPECLQLRTCSAVPTRADWRDEAASRAASAFCNGTAEGRGQHPVNCVSHAEAAQFCSAQGKRLLTADEWVWAATSGAERRPFPWGKGAPTGAQLCWGKPGKRASTCTVGSTPRDATAQGVLDMAGNVSEWVAKGGRFDLYGASWYATDDGYVAAALGGFESPAVRSELFGIRCGRDPAR